MHPSSIISFYPTYAILDEAISSKNYKNVNFFFDMKNIANSLYMEHAVVNLIENTERYKRIDTSIFSALLSFISFHKIYSIKRNVKSKFHIFYETGQSYYHKNIYKKYKISRKIDDFFGLDREKREIFYNIIQMNLLLIERACNKMPDMKVIMLPHLEADFVPYFIQRNNLLNQDDETLNITYSNDHDMWQNLNENSYIFMKTPKNKRIVKDGEALSLFCKKEVDVDDKYFPIVMAIAGDTSDDIPGIKGIGAKRATNIVEELVSIAGGLDKIYENVCNGICLFKKEDLNNGNKLINDVIEEEIENNRISDNLKLSSFEVLSRFLDNPNSTEMLEKRKIIENVINNNEITTYKNMKKALELSNIYVDEDVLGSLYYRAY